VRLSLAFHAPDIDEAAQAEDVRHQAEEWAAAEPNLAGITVLNISRPDASRPHGWIVELELRMRSEDAQMDMAL